jgi:hypothetical protein
MCKFRDKGNKSPEHMGDSFDRLCSSFLSF